MKRLAVTLGLLIAIVSTGCFNRQAAPVGLAAGSLLAIAGGAMLLDVSGPGRDTDRDGVDEFPDQELACLLICPIGTGMLILGGAMVVTGAIALNQDEPSPPPAPLPQARPTISSEVAQLDLPFSDTLPELPCDAQTLQLAKQARNAARHGECEHATLITAQIRARDTRYADGLVASPALASCR